MTLNLTEVQQLSIEVSKTGSVRHYLMISAQERGYVVTHCSVRLDNGNFSLFLLLHLEEKSSPRFNTLLYQKQSCFIVLIMPTLSAVIGVSSVTDVTRRGCETDLNS